VVADLRFALRMLVKTPAMTAIAVLTLALGIGANTAIFSAVNALLLRPLPVENPRQLVSGYSMRDGVDPYTTSLLEYTAYRERSHSFSSTGIGTPQIFDLVERGEPHRLQGAAVTAEYLVTLGVKTSSGRVFRMDEDLSGSAPVALISYELWQRLFGGDPGMIGRSLNFEGGTYTVVGILPPAFNMPFAAEVWVPLQLNMETLPLEQRAQNGYDFVARLKPGVSLTQADAELKHIAGSLEQEYPQFRRGWSYKLISLRQNLIGDLHGTTRDGLFALMAGVGFVLLICCANLANLLLARGVTREREISIRFALGAGRFKIVRQLLIESLVLAMLGGTVGLLLAYWIAPILGRLSPIQAVSLASLLRDFRIDWHVLAFVFALCLLAAGIFGSVPALKAIASNDLITVMKQRDQRVGAFAGRRMLEMLVVSEIALAATLLVSGGLLVQSFYRLERIHLGFRPENLLMMEIPLSPNKYHDHSQRVAFAQQVIEQVRALPAVVSVSTTTNFPLQLFDAGSSYTVEGRSSFSEGSAPATIHRVVSPDYFKTLGAALLKGRALTEQDTSQSLPVVVVNKELARLAWPGDEPIGKRIRCGGPNATNFPWLTVIGVVENIKEDRFNFRTDRPTWYLPYAQHESSNPLQLMVRASHQPGDLIAPIRRTIHAIDPNQSISNSTTMRAYLTEVLMRDRFSAILMGTLAAIGLALATIGLYGVMAYSVGRRTGEIGLRLALGARPHQILWLVFSRALPLIVCGLVVGLSCARVVGLALSGILYQINASDPSTFLLVALLLGGIAILGCYFPARWASKLDPALALRSE
jgi:putative ABC transport system permease protein